MMLCAATPDTVSLVLPIGLLVAGLVLIGAEFFLPTVVLGFIGAVISFAGIYLSAAAGAGTCAVFCGVFLVVLALEFFAFRFRRRRPPWHARLHAGSGLPSSWA